MLREQVNEEQWVKTVLKLQSTLLYFLNVYLLIMSKQQVANPLKKDTNGSRQEL
jgi:hypothetical protein